MKSKKHVRVVFQRAIQLISEFSIHLPGPFCVFYYTLSGSIKIGNTTISNNTVMNLWLTCTILTCIAYIKIFYHKKSAKFTIAFSSLSTCIIYSLKMVGLYFIAWGMLLGIVFGVILLWKRGNRNIFYIICVSIFCLSCIVFVVTNIWIHFTTIVKLQDKNEEQNQYTYERLIKQIDYFDTYGIEKKMMYLQELVTLEAKHLGIEEHIEVYVSTLNDGTNGLFRTDWENMIFINRNYLTDPDTESSEIIKSTLHELHHCYVNKVVLLMKRNAINSKLAYFNRANSWLENSYNYIDPEEASYDDYYVQPMELDANKWAEERISSIYGTMGSFEKK